MSVRNGTATSWPEHLHGKRATVRLADGDVISGVLRRTRAGWRMGDPVRGPGAAWIDELMEAVDLGLVPELGPVDAWYADVEHVPELDPEGAGR